MAKNPEPPTHVVRANTLSPADVSNSARTPPLGRAQRVRRRSSSAKPQPNPNPRAVPQPNWSAKSRSGHHHAMPAAAAWSCKTTHPIRASVR